MTVPAQTYRVFSLPYAINCTQRYFSYIAEHFASPVLLQSDALAQAIDRRGRFDILAAEPDFSVALHPSVVHMIGDVPEGYRHLAGLSPVQITAELLNSQSSASSQRDEVLPFIGGFIGYLSYDYGRLVQGIVDVNDINPADLPLAQWRYYSWSIIIDHVLATCSLVVNERLPDTFADELLTQLSELPDKPIQPLKPPAFEAVQSQASYLAAVNRIKDYIRAGDCYQVNYAQCFRAQSSVPALDYYWHLQQQSPAPFAAFYTISEQASILSFSPERFVALSAHGRLLTQPIKGTVGRSIDAEIDRELALQLQQDEKNRAENVMIVDLLRNDFGRIAAIGSVAVSKLFELQSFSNVHHLVSTIEADLAPEYTVASIWQHCFPGGSITGAPKKRAMEIIDELESVPRSVYCGSIIYVSDCGNSDSNILIRTILQQNDKLYCWGGGGIVYDSTAESEYQESLTKINRLINS